MFDDLGKVFLDLKILLVILNKYIISEKLKGKKEEVLFSTEFTFKEVVVKQERIFV